MSFDILQFDDDNQARLTARVPDLRTVDSCDSVDDAMQRAVNLPGGFTLYDGSKGEGRLVPQDPAQFCVTRLSIILVARSLRSKQDAKRAMYPLVRAAKNGFDHWTNPQCVTEFVYEDDNFVQRVGERVAWEVIFSARIYDDFQG